MKTHSVARRRAARAAALTVLACALGSSAALAADRIVACICRRLARPRRRDLFDSRRAVNNFADIKGLKLRVPKSKAMIATFQAFNAEPVPLAWLQRHRPRLQTSTIDGGDNGMSVIKGMKFRAFAKRPIVLDHRAGVNPMFASDRIMKKLGAKYDPAIRKAAIQAGAHHTVVQAEETREARDRVVKESGMAITRPAREPFIAAAQKVQAELAAEKGPKFAELIESGCAWAAGFLQHPVRDRNVLLRVEAIPRITSLPASRVRLADRGTLKVGNWGDVHRVRCGPDREPLRHARAAQPPGRHRARDGERRACDARQPTLRCEQRTRAARIPGLSAVASRACTRGRIVVQ